MKKVVLATMAVLVAVMFASVAVAATSTSTSSPCNKCGKPACSSCVKPAPCNKCATPCAKPCGTCGNACMPLPKVNIDWKWPRCRSSRALRAQSRAQLPASSIRETSSGRGYRSTRSVKEMTGMTLRRDTKRPGSAVSNIWIESGLTL